MNYKFSNKFFKRELMFYRLMALLIILGIQKKIYF